jgi:hypothetical protein
LACSSGDGCLETGPNVHDRRRAGCLEEAHSRALVPGGSMFGAISCNLSPHLQSTRSAFLDDRRRRSGCEAGRGDPRRCASSSSRETSTRNAWPCSSAHPAACRAVSDRGHLSEGSIATVSCVLYPVGIVLLIIIILLSINIVGLNVHTITTTTTDCIARETGTSAISLCTFFVS